MDVNHITAEPDPDTAVAAYTSQLARLDAPPALPGDAELGPALPEAADLPAVRVSAAGAAPAAEGVVIYVHGGGFEHRTPKVINLVAHRFSRAVGRPVLSVHYRLAPDHPYPAPLEDVLTVYRTALDQGVPAERIVLLGESSGAALVLSALLAIRDSDTPLPAGAVTFSAMTDMTVSSPSVDADPPHDAVERAMLTDLIGRYLGGARADEAPQSPLHGSLEGLPPLLMAVGGAEALRDDTLRFAESADAAGSTVEVDVYDAMPHVFHLLTIDEDDPTGGKVLERTGAWIASRIRGAGSA
ncbi:alpha/beta hydrolase fold domain-containing protein [Streptomonospora alba]|uniref:alpha/beta hydrolase fold domain-containing protein n=1 Tax=Streptomonospora alba TaxID=183763 RepID=UPI000A66B46B|nr:alpha/beta hydrolase fold domain-containing protein [Streptomonospora alba]